MLFNDEVTYVAPQYKVFSLPGGWQAEVANITWWCFWWKIRDRKVSNFEEIKNDFLDRTRVNTRVHIYKEKNNSRVYRDVTEKDLKVLFGYAIAEAAMKGYDPFDVKEMEEH